MRSTSPKLGLPSWPLWHLYSCEYRRSLVIRCSSLNYRSYNYSVLMHHKMEGQMMTESQEEMLLIGMLALMWMGEHCRRPCKNRESRVRLPWNVHSYSHRMEVIQPQEWGRWWGQHGCIVHHAPKVGEIQRPLFERQHVVRLRGVVRILVKIRDLLSFYLIFEWRLLRIQRFTMIIYGLLQDKNKRPWAYPIWCFSMVGITNTRLDWSHGGSRGAMV